MALHHPRYVATDKEHAQAASWVFTSTEKKPPQLYYHQLPALQADEVTIKVLYTSLCKSDLHTVRGDWGPVKDWPFCPGHEVIGEISKVGSGCKHLTVGMKVGVTPLRGSCSKCEYCAEDHDQHCEKRSFLYSNFEPFFGGYSTHVQCQEKHAIPLPHGLNIATAAPLLCAGLTVFAPLRRYAKAGLKCAVVGIGGLGHLGIQFANRMGMQVTAFTTSQGRTGQLKMLGAVNIRHSTNFQKLKQEEGKYDIVLNTLSIQNEQLYKAYQRLCAANGTMIMVAAPSVKTNLQLDIAYLLTKNITIASSLIGSKKDAVDMFEFCFNYGVEPVVQPQTFDKFPDAFDKLENGSPKYRVCVEVGSWAKANKLDH